MTLVPAAQDDWAGSEADETLVPASAQRLPVARGPGTERGVGGVLCGSGGQWPSHVSQAFYFDRGFFPSVRPSFLRVVSVAELW